MDQPTGIVTCAQIHRCIEHGERPTVRIEKLQFTHCALIQWYRRPDMSICGIIDLMRKGSSRISDAVTVPLARQAENIEAAFKATWDIILAPPLDGSRIETLEQANARLELGAQLIRGRLETHAPELDADQKRRLESVFRRMKSEHLKGVEKSLRDTVSFSSDKVTFSRGS